MKFSELDKNAKLVAIKDYITGWKETHPKESITIQEANNLCLDIEDDINYTSEGKVND